MEINNISKELKLIRFLYIGSALGISFINYGPVESVLICRDICLIIVMIANVSLMLIQINKTPQPSNLIVNISLLVLFTVILITYIFYINKSYSLDKSTSILKNSFSNSFIILFVFLCIYLSYNVTLDFTTSQYCILLLFCSLMICLLYPLIITILYYKTDGFKNIYI